MFYPWTYNKNYEKYKNDYLDVFTQDYNSNLNLESNYIEKQNNDNIIKIIIIYFCYIIINLFCKCYY